MGDFTTIGAQFIQFFYQTFDTDRKSLVNLFRPNSMLTFETEQFLGTENIINKFLGIGAERLSHAVMTADYQPCPDGTGTNRGIIVLVTGTLTMDQEMPMKYSEVFNLQPAPDAEGSYYVFNELFKLNLG